MSQTSRTPRSKRKTKAELNAEQEALIETLMEVPENELACRDPGLAHQWNLDQNFHVIASRWRGTPMQMIARDSICGRCGKTKQERWVIGRDDVLVKTGNHYSVYEVPLSGFSRGRIRASAVWTAGYRKTMRDAAKDASKGTKKISTLRVAG